MENFQLFMGCLGNGTSVCNKAVMEYGDYKKVAHISDHGVIKFYVSESYIPTDAMQKIRKAAEASKAEFMKKWNKKTDLQKYEYMLRIPTIGCGFTAMDLIDMNNRHLSLTDRVQLMEKTFFNTHI